MKIKKQELIKLVKAVLLICAAPIAVISVYALMGRMSYDHALIAIVAITAATTFFIHPYIANIHALTDYVNKLAEDKTASEPDLSFLNNLEGLSSAVENLNESWDRRKTQLEAALAENKIVIEVLPDPLFILDENQIIMRTNGMARQLFGHRLTGKHLQEILPIDNLITALRHVKQVSDVEFNLDGEIRRDFIAKVTKFPTNSPSYTDTILTLHDLTELKQIRRMRADFVANASHEMKTPLASIIGLIETLQTSAKDDGAARAEFLHIMSEQADRMKRLISDLLSLSKIEADTSAPEGELKIPNILNEVKRHSKWHSEQKNVTVTLDISKNLPILRGDKEQITQVFVNLIQNAIKYGHKDSEVIVKAQVTRKLPVELSDKYDRAVQISVIDKSDGIPPEHIPRLTERFYRVDTARTRKLGGTGLGLAIVKHILSRHNSILKVESEVGVGSVFSVYIPFVDNTALLNPPKAEENSDDNLSDSIN